MEKKERVVFTKEMKEDYTILIPQMAPFHFDLIASALRSFGYQCEVLKNENSNIAYLGNKYVHNDTCVPAIYVIGQFMDAINSGQYDIHKIALIITQTGGGCRASNYIHLLREALDKAGYGFIPVISLNASNIESNPGFKMSLPLLKKFVQSLVLGDLIMQLHNESIPYEVHQGSTQALSNQWLQSCATLFEENKLLPNKVLYQQMKVMIDSYQAIEINQSIKPKVGIVGEIYVKYSPLGNNNLEAFLLKEGCEVVTPGIVDFILYTFESTAYDIKQYGGSKIKKVLFEGLSKYVEGPRKKINQLLKETRFRQQSSFSHIKELASPFIGAGTHVGEGWLLTGEIVELIEMGVSNVITTQPFGCLPNHVVARGMFKSIKSQFPQANLISIDYDTSASVINQENRIKLLILNAKNKLVK